MCGRLTYLAHHLASEQLFLFLFAPDVPWPGDANPDHTKTEQSLLSMSPPQQFTIIAHLPIWMSTNHNSEYTHQYT